MWTILRTIQEKNKRTHAHYHYRKNTSGREGKALDNIDLNQMSHRYVSGVLQNEPSTSAHLIDRCENVSNVEKKSTSNMLIMEALNSPEIRKNTKATTVNQGQNFHCYNNDYNIMISFE